MVDSAPIITPHLSDRKKEQDDEDRTVEVPEFVGKPPTIPEVDQRSIRFDKAITDVINLEKRSEWKELIQDTGCFGKLWKDTETNEFCEELECDLRQLCQSVWDKVEGGLAADENPPRWRTKKRILIKTQKKKKKTKKWNGTDKYIRVPYSGTDRPVDAFASTLHGILGEPPELPSNWYYPAARTKEQLHEAPKEFMERYGSGVRYCGRASYLQYFFMGRHLLRFWVVSGGGGWLDCSKLVSRAIAKDGKLDLVETPKSGYKTKFRFYPYRVYISKNLDLKKLESALHKIKDLLPEQTETVE